MTEEEIDRLSTEEERWASNQWSRLQRNARLNGYMDETALLEASQASGILAIRNKRLGLTGGGKNAQV